MLLAAAAALAYATGESADRRGDARLLWVSLSFLVAAGFLGLHALATPGVFLEASNLGFQIAVPVGLVVASVLAAVSALPDGPGLAPTTRARARWLRGALLALRAARTRRGLNARHAPG